MSDLTARRRTPTVPDPDRRPPVDPGEPAAPRSLGQDAGEWAIPRIPLQYERTVLAGAVVREKLRAPVVWGRGYDVAAHQQAATPELLLGPAAAAPEYDNQKPEAGALETIDFKELRALKASRTDVEALEFTAEQLRRATEVFTKAGDEAAARTRKYTDPQDAPAPHPARDGDQRAHRPQQTDRHRGMEAGR
ncbi:hypothetical protein ABZ371_06890 [Streptomyces sp. NPDC005899]|uniref:hypothetical protein n=1 Tax=Streptomyces sp. NPDC005899 TaxID=3155716 RepID=UPI003402C0A2